MQPPFFLPGPQSDDRADYFFQRNTSMLEGVSVEIHVVVIVVWVGKELVFLCKDERLANVHLR